VRQHGHSGESTGNCYVPAVCRKWMVQLEV